MLQLSHKKLNVWQSAIDFTVYVYQILDEFPKKEDYCLSTQIRRATVSVSSNIAEGAARKSKLERKRFYEISRSSLVEIDNQFEIAIRLKYLNDEQIKNISKGLNNIFAMMTNMINKTAALD